MRRFRGSSAQWKQTVCLYIRSVIFFLLQKLSRCMLIRINNVSHHSTNHISSWFADVVPHICVQWILTSYDWPQHYGLFVVPEWLTTRQPVKIQYFLFNCSFATVTYSTNYKAKNFVNAFDCKPQMSIIVTSASVFRLNFRLDGTQSNSRLFRASGARQTFHFSWSINWYQHWLGFNDLCL